MMSLKKFMNYDARNIFIFSLSNIGDVVLTCPVIDSLFDRFQGAEISVAVGPKAKSLFAGNPYLKNVYVFDKHQPFFKMRQWVKELRREKFDAVIDLRETALGLFLRARHRTPIFAKKQKALHMRLKHFERLKSVFPDVAFSPNRYAIFLNEEQKHSAQRLLDEAVGPQTRYAVLAAGSADQKKRWTQDGFAEIAS